MEFAASRMVLEKALQGRAEELKSWLDANGRECWDEQKHLEEGTPEQIYWHFGYFSALRDVLKQLGRQVH